MNHQSINLPSYSSKHKLIAILAALFLFFANHSIYLEIRISHLFIFIAISGLLWLYCYSRLELFFLSLAAHLLLLGTISNALCTTSCVGFNAEIIKLPLLLVGSVYLGKAVKFEWEALFAILTPIVVISVIWNYINGDWDYYDPVAHRFGVPMLGSPNSTAYVLSFFALTAFIQFYESRKGAKHWLWLAAGVILLSGIILTQSRGGALIFLIAVLVVFRVNILGLLAICLFMLLAYLLIDPEQLTRFNLWQDLSTTGGSGRIQIWTHLLNSTFNNPWSLLSGNGPGTIALDLWGHITESAHSGFISFIYWYGITGLLLALTYVGLLTHRVFTAHSNMVRGVSALLMVSFFIDGYLFDMNILLINIAALSLVTMTDKNNRPWNQHKHCAYIQK